MSYVLVKGTPDSDTIQAVYGPYTEAHAAWIMRELLCESYGRWTLMELASFTEPQAAPGGLARPVP